MKTFQKTGGWAVWLQPHMQWGIPPTFSGRATVKENGTQMSQAAWWVSKDFDTSLYIPRPVESNPRDLNRKVNQAKNCKAKMELLRSCEPQKQIAEDFCSGDDSNFDLMPQVLQSLPREDTPVGPVGHHPATRECLQASTGRTFE